MLLIEGLLLPTTTTNKKLIHQEINFKNEIWVKKFFFTKIILLSLLLKYMITLSKKDFFEI